MSLNTPESSDDSNSTQTRAKRSKVWEHFEQNLVEVDNCFRAVCKYCRMQLSTKSGTSSLRTHISQYCHAIGEAERNRFIATLKKPIENFVFDPQFSRERMIEFVIHAEIPFNKFEDPYFEPWVQSMQPTLSVVGRQTVRNDCLKKYQRMKQDIQNELESLDSHVCLTSDLWTSIQNLGYMVVTAHYITPDFKIKKKIISFKEVKYPHSGFAIEEALVSCLTEWGIRNKLFTLTVDNASNNNTACDLLVDTHKYELMLEGAHLHVRCCAHILNILVQDGMKIIHEGIKKIRELLKHIISSPSRMQAFNEIAVVNGLPTKRGIALDIPNRWNSTFKMVAEAIKYKTVLNSYANQHAEIPPNEQEWSTADSICKFLKTFEEATKAISAHRKPTSYMFLPLIVSIRDALDNPSWQTSVALQDLAAAMRIKFEKYWGRDFDESNQPIPRRNKKDYDVNLGIVIATMLDPRGKAEYAEFFYQKICSNIDQIDSSVDAALVWMKKYFLEYEQRLRRVNAYSVTYSSEGSICVGSPVLAKRQLGSEFANFKSSRRKTRPPKSEFDIYFEEDCVEDIENFDILAWWKAHAEKFPILSVMARDFLAIPLSIVSSESAFSLGGRILGESRSSLTPEMLEALVCGKDWLFKEKDADNEGQQISEDQTSEIVTFVTPSD
ncbi:zinc finger BED domain-containing protein RICESLEEPER 2-like [Setaria italica]|uniref:zinc finger BED domain-containing protein RICESLEEPER 2-like n=1 Tax=Setaria italica TaxID=4555 RepID=UPI000648A7BD|nr:zinc finger BED domain-containing protein RICESLEEPER 2-like [Setaria italica]